MIEVQMYDDNQSRSFGESLDDDSSLIWRYISLPVLLQMLQTNTIFFPSVATLAKADPLEGRWSANEAQIVDAKMKETCLRELRGLPGTELEQKRLESQSVTTVFHEAIGRYVFANCWHENNNESGAMWAIYGSNHGIALQSRVGLLKSAFAIEERPVALVRVEYDVDLRTAQAPIRTVFRKRGSFSHEREIRATVISEPSSDPGIYVKIDIATLIEQLYLWPFAPAWMSDVVRTEVRLHGLDKPVKKSALYDPV
jgi:hypothetical protein